MRVIRRRLGHRNGYLESEKWSTMFVRKPNVNSFSMHHVVFPCHHEAACVNLFNHLGLFMNAIYGYIFDRILGFKEIGSNPSWLCVP